MLKSWKLWICIFTLLKTMNFMDSNSFSMNIIHKFKLKMKMYEFINEKKKII
jgi:hypothetical protein